MHILHPFRDYTLITSLYAVPPGMGLQDVPFLLETRIKELGGTYSCAGPGEVKGSPSHTLTGTWN